MGRYRMRTYRGEKIEVTLFHSFFNESFDDRVLIFLSPVDGMEAVQE